MTSHASPSSSTSEIGETMAVMTKTVVRLYVNGESDGFPLYPDEVHADREGFTLVFDPEFRWFPWVREDGKRNSFKSEAGA